jgi:hypothetical protein
MNLEDKVNYVRANVFDPGPAHFEAVALAGGGRYQPFQYATFYENPGGDCFEVHGLIRDKYVDFHETVGDMGFPTSDELDDPAVSGGRLNTFEHGTIAWDPASSVQVTLWPSNDGSPVVTETETPNSGAVAAPVVGAGDWQTVLDDYTSSEADVAAVIRPIREKRDSIPAYVKPTKGGYVYYGKVNRKPSAIVPGSIEDWIWQEVSSEGAFDSINANDNQAVTWGKGIAKSNITGVLKALFRQNSDLEAAFKEVGVAFGGDGGLQVVKTDDASIATGNDAFDAMKADTKLLDFLADIPNNAAYQDIIIDAQWAFVMQFNPHFVDHVAANGWSKDAAQLAFHLSYWLPGYGWKGNMEAYKATGGDATRIILLFKQKQKQFQGELVSHLKTFAGNAFKKYIALEKYLPELPPEQCAVFTDAGTSYYVPL